jgi:hypothetical protein
MGATLRLGSRVSHAARWRRLAVDGERFDAWCWPAALRRPRGSRRPRPGWAAQAAGLRYEPIVTVYLQCEGARLPRR